MRAVAAVGPTLPPAQTSQTAVAEVSTRADRRPPRLRVAVTAVGAAAAIALVTFATAAVPSAEELPYMEALSPADDVVAPVHTVATTRVETIEAAPAPPSQSPGRVELRWPPVSTADYYNVILWSDGTRLNDYWPRNPRIAFVPRELARLGVSNGSTIHWFVYPITVEGGNRVAGSVHANGSFTLRGSRRAR